RAYLLVLGDAVGVASGMTERRHRRLARARATDVDHEQAQGSTNRRIGAISRPEDAEAAVEADACAHRPVYEDEGCRKMCRRGHAVEIERRFARALGGGEHDR